MMQFMKLKFEEVIMRFTDTLVSECNVDKTKIIGIWNNIAPECAIEMKKTKSVNNKKDDVEKHYCEHVFGIKSTKPNEKCGIACKDSEPSNDGKFYCSKHKKSASIRSCCFIDESGNVCECKVNGAEFDHDDEYNGVNYKGKYVCKKHETQLKKYFDKKSKQCEYVYGDKSKNHAGERCSSEAKDGKMCKKHSGTNNKQKLEQMVEEHTKKVIKENDDDNDEKVDVKNDTKKKDKEDKTKLNIKLNFKLVRNKAKKPKFMIKKLKSSDGTFTAIVDTVSGLVCINPENPDCSEFEEESIEVIGIWDNEEQYFTNLTDESKTYAKNLGLKLYDTSNNDNEEENNNEEDDGNDSEESNIEDEELE